MKKEITTINNITITVYSLNTVVVGSGAAGLNAADRLHTFGQTDIAVVTEGMNMGTSRNTGSDKQTYYKITLAGDARDSVFEMAETLYNGGAMHGDIALVEAAMSARCFYHLVDIGVPFPHNRYGEYIGYKTDHDPRQRATSVGPLTSKFMTEKLQEQIERKHITIFDGYQVIGILTDRQKHKAVGLLTLNLNDLDNADNRYVLFNCTNIVYAAGGAAGMYGASVYPVSQTGASGIAFEAGVKGKNLTESQFGIASTKFRWNLSGTYQQVLPRYVSTDSEGNGQREFLDSCFGDPGSMLDAIFLKGYQWPFDPRKLQEKKGSSLVDLMVYNETVVKGRRVFLDFTNNPSTSEKKGELDFSLLGQESHTYLEKSGALFGRPIDRLIHMNKPAYDLYLDHDIDLQTDLLEIAVCAQHNNGGLYGNIWWESTLEHFFPVGEINGSHGVYRPGGSALNSGQVGSTRAAQYIAQRYSGQPESIDAFLDTCREQIKEKLEIGETFAGSIGKESSVVVSRKAIGRRMDRCGAIIRSLETVREGIDEALGDLKNIAIDTKISSIYELPKAFRNYDLLLSQFVYLSAIASYIEDGGRSRGSYIISDPDGQLPSHELPEMFRVSLEGDNNPNRVQVAAFDNGECRIEWEAARPIPKENQWFETIWNAFLNDEIVR